MIIIVLLQIIIIHIKDVFLDFLLWVTMKLHEQLKEIIEESNQSIIESIEFDTETVVGEFDIELCVNTFHLITLLFDVGITEHRQPQFKHHAVLWEVYKLLPGVHIQVNG